VENIDGPVLKIMLVVGARPNFMKAAPLVERIRHYRDSLEPILVHTGQHYDQKLSGLFFDELGLPKPNLYMGVGSGSHAAQTARIMVEFENIILEDPPHLVVVLGDVNSTIACALVAAKCHIPVAHVEAGLRSFEMSMPEEINRVLTDRISDYLFITESSAYQNLKNEGYDDNKIFFVGNVMIDSLLAHRKKAESRGVLGDLKLESKGYALLTLHRPANVDNIESLTDLISAMAAISEKVPVVFPCHPRTRINIDNFGLSDYFKPGKIRLIEPLGYLDFLKMESEALMVLTDSGGIQEETTILNVPCLTLRTSTERPVTITEGTNILVGPFPEKIIAEAGKILSGDAKIGRIPKYWDGKAAERIVDVFLNIRQDILSLQPRRVADTKSYGSVFSSSNFPGHREE
jgi:UDP-N-acetylglucosamine 2-epimerase (non-hydrolysing)